MHSESEVLARLHSGDRLHPNLAFAIVALVLIGVVAVFAPTAQSMVEIYARSGTFTHGFLVLPATLWFVWGRRFELAVAPSRPFWPGLIAIAVGSFAWLVSELSGSLAPSHFALFALAVSAVVTIFGLRWAQLLAFPLVFLVFAVPFGDAFVPTLIEWTADFTVRALQATGVPVLREGNELTIPSGRWSVVETCSGVRYLLSAAMAGVLFAWTMFRSPVRRGLFIAASIAVPIVANWVRAYMIVMLGHLSGNTIAVGVDHLLYGWLFFGLVIFPMFWFGARWREQPAVAPSPIQSNEPDDGRQSFAQMGSAAIMVLVLLLAAQTARSMLIDVDDYRAVVVSPIAGAAGWVPTETPAGQWQPALQAPRAFHLQTFEKAGERVTLMFGVYRAQRQGSELVTWANQLDGGLQQRDWLRMSRSTAAVNSGGRKFDAELRVLRSREQQIALLRWYWMPEVSTVSDTRAKINLAIDRLLRSNDTSAWVAISTSSDPLVPHASISVLQRFAAEMGEEVDAALRRTAAR